VFLSVAVVPPSSGADRFVDWTMMPRHPVDLHMHSTASDGEELPERLAERCRDAGLRTVALTDHNSTAHVRRMTAACTETGIEVLPACEISTSWKGREHHCLAYFVPLDDEVFGDRIERVRQEDLARSRRWVDNAAADGVDITWERVEAEVGRDRVPPFAYLARVLAASGDKRLERYREHRGSMFGEWFAKGRPWSTEDPWRPSLPEAIGWVREAGGVPVLAHPGATLGDLDPAEAFADLQAEGLLGVEAWTTWHKREASQRFEGLAHEAGLSVTAGADFHGPVVKPFVSGPGQVEENGLERLRELEAAHEVARG
jgi:predicted metal-dependent phosphoesterase TrpH